ncbi:uncharacterized protein LOC124818483 [Hydra vulgaris]|uniref:uncharacterized protein LOC105850329 n=2 Tax=Hydra vulgaris TaxID=6087 RepID=UPI001F5ECEE1|nr:uncharacterized protein LOC124810271 [Hydra vulgaris]XP_047131918.1 uncharacterized protein LOC105850329 [Hydra vulgaris]XP_047145401.1 uncharacterized protein LOC124818483 [Hydra vulgaris]
MTQKRNLKKAIDKYVMCVFLENVNGAFAEQKTVVPKRWIDEELMLLWWPNGINVTNKKSVNPNKDTWKKYDLKEVVIEGEESVCHEFLLHTSSSESDVKKKKFKEFDSSKGKSVPNKPTISIMDVIEKATEESSSISHQTPQSPSPIMFSPVHHHHSESPDSYEPPSYSSGASRYPLKRTSSHLARSQCGPFQGLSGDFHYSSPGSVFHTSAGDPEGTTCHSSRTSYKSESPVHLDVPFHTSSFPQNTTDFLINASSSDNPLHSSKTKFVRKDSAKLLNQKFPMDTGEFQKLVLQLLLEKNCCKCANKTSESVNITFFKKIESLEELFELETRLKDNGEYSKLLCHLKKAGGKTVKENTKNVMVRIMEHHVMAKLNMKGKIRGDFKKVAFEDKKLCKAIIEAIQLTHESSTEAQIKEQIGSILKFSPFVNKSKKNNIEEASDC